jgi:hypothetical protein
VLKGEMKAMATKIYCIKQKAISVRILLPQMVSGKRKGFENKKSVMKLIYTEAGS